MPDAGRWRKEMAYLGLRPVEAGGLAQARRLLGWARSKPGRADGRVSRRWVARVLLRQHWHHPGEQTIVAGHQQLADEITRLGGPRLSRQSVQRIVQEMLDDGVLFLAKRGCSAAMTGDRNHVSVYVVAEPDTLDEQAQELVDQLAARLVGHLPEGYDSRVELGDSPARKAGPISTERSTPLRRAHPEDFETTSPGQRQAAISWLIADFGWRDTPTTRAELGKVCGPFFAAGWSAAAIRAAIDRTPDRRWHDGPLPGWAQRDRRTPLQVRNVYAVVTWRLKFWLVDGRPVAPPLGRRVPLGRPRSAALPTPWTREPTAPSSDALGYLAALGLRAGSLR